MKTFLTSKVVSPVSSGSWNGSSDRKLAEVVSSKVGEAIGGQTGAAAGKVIGSVLGSMWVYSGK